MMQKISKFISGNRRFLPLSATIMLFFVVYLAGTIFAVNMRDPQVFFNLFRTSPFLLISAVGMTFVILTGGIDLSVSGVIALSTVVCAALLREGWSPWAVMPLVLVMGMGLGTIMGFFITYLKVQPFIATLAGMWVARGICYFISDDAIAINNRIYRILGQTKILIPGLADPVAKTGAYVSILVVLMLLVLVAAIFILHSTKFGRAIYAIGGNEQSARLMGLPVNSTKVLVYTLNGFCSALAGITLSIYVMSGHGNYASGFEMTVIAAVVIGGTMLTGGSGYVFGTLFGVLITGLIQTLILFNGKLSSWWTSIVVGLLTLGFILVQSLLAARRQRQVSAERLISQAKDQKDQSRHKKGAAAEGKKKRNILLGSGAVLAVAIIAIAVITLQNRAQSGQATTSGRTSTGCTLLPFRQDQAASAMNEGAVLAFELNGGASCVDKVYAIYPDGRITLDDGTQKMKKKLEEAQVDKLLEGIKARGWFTEEMYSTSHTPCGQCFTYFIDVAYEGQEKLVKAVDGGTDAPADYWQVVSLINGFIPDFEAEP
ncbi:MAG: galactofuranose ABC transporter, permease protein YjfF [Anaerolineaceae bacterium]